MLEIKRSKLRAGPRRKRALAVIKRVMLTILILTMLFVVAGLVYTWYMGQKPAPVIQEPVPVKKQTVVTPVKPDDDARIGAAVQTLTSPIQAGSNASISIHTTAGAACSIEVLYNKIASTDSGLIPKVADEFGMVSWTWTVESSRPAGTWPVNITCAYNERSIFVRGDLVVKSATR